MTTTFLPQRQRSVATTELPKAEAISAFHQSLPGYEQTPLYSCPTIAQRLGVARVVVKDESERLGLPSFKMLGASWATATAIAREWIGTTELPRSFNWIVSAMDKVHGRHWREGRQLVAATDGNHGRGVARMARMLKVSCHIFVPLGTARSRIRGIRSEGARVDVVDGTYDDAIARSAREATSMSLVISDTSWEGYTETPTNVIHGYSTMFSEIDRQLGDVTPNLVALQSGVGAFAAAAISHWGSATVDHRPRFLIVEPSAANCLLLSAQRGKITLAPGPHDSTMAGLNCGLPSLIAWPTIHEYADGYVAIDDNTTFEAMRLLAKCGIVAGESGAAGLAGLLAITDPNERGRLGMTGDATVVVINTEWATDPKNFRRAVGASAKGVMLTRHKRRSRTNTVQLAGS